ncbi:MAG: hypothetical protein IV086_07510 [Hyphomonadaceae bacterium]|nr:MAG: hypothetical protein FD160_1287 [Caulobacteraceae bacterium]MBT9445526.1 hypothetical protein [Hyphomonadaceae bacterium]TPW07363.1 MAG: hypothetical protein FD124_1199 [Alphaproteobacteria bacterium]
MAALLALLCAAPSTAAQTPAVRLVFFTADWCPNCQVLEPALASALSRVEGVARLDIDVTNALRREESRVQARAANVTRLYDAYAGRTGFAVIARADTGETIGCVTSVYSAAEIEAALRSAVRSVRSPAVSTRRIAGACPGA